MTKEAPALLHNRPVRARGHFTKNGERREAWGANLSRALWYTSKGSGGTVKEGRMSVAEFLRFLEDVNPQISANAWASKPWDVTLPNGVTLAFVPESAS